MRPFLLTSLFLVLAVPALAKPTRRTVLDYFKMIPASAGMFDQPNSRLEDLRRGFGNDIKAPFRSIVDVANDFLHLPGDGAQPTLDIAVFRFHGQDTVAIVDDWEDNSELSFWREEEGQLRKMPRSFFPFSIPKSCSVELPRHGTTICIVSGNSWEHPKPQKLVARFLWRGGRFTRE